ncbi:chemotaxis protein MotC [Rhizobium helianthi]|uniref:Chemotaxis protein MotC n=1 Tax=Rhizobium helianthi TaxID=1132695 RepID=A0ABW4M709_9HYPH
MIWRIRHPFSLLAATALSVVWPNVSGAQQAEDNLEPYQMVRSLQYVQDTVVMGDHSAGEMQRFLLGTIDKRLRSVSPRAFDDPRNADAALIYAMSGGNPATLEYLVSKDTAGNFDNRVANALRKYLAGRGTMISGGLSAMVPEYRDQRIGPYLALVAGNVMIATDRKKALSFYDTARLLAPGTIVEEAALRRSVAVAVEEGDASRGLRYSRQYARRFSHSPYASQFADLFVTLVVDHYGTITIEDVDGALEVMDDDRAQEIFLRMARQATIKGNADLAKLAADRAGSRTDGARETGATAAKLFESVSQVSTSQVKESVKALEEIPDEALSAQDRALRDAARRVAEEVVRPPSLESLEQDKAATVENQISAEQTSALPGHDAVGAGGAATLPAANAHALDPDFKTFVDRGRSRLGAIDDMLKEER